MGDQEELCKEQTMKNFRVMEERSIAATIHKSIMITMEKNVEPNSP